MPQISNIVEQFGTYARTWVYVGNRELNQTESTWLVEQVISFTNTWQTHGKPMNATGFVFSNRALVLVANEDGVKASGCSMDKINHFVKQMGAALEINFFDRMQTLVFEDDQWTSSRFNPNEIRPVISAATLELAHFLI
jgi:hypothetical protein